MILSPFKIGAVCVILIQSIMGKISVIDMQNKYIVE